jgi:hypothetical protein
MRGHHREHRRARRRRNATDQHECTAVNLGLQGSSEHQAKHVWPQVSDRSGPYVISLVKRTPSSNIAARLHIRTPTRSVLSPTSLATSLRVLLSQSRTHNNPRRCAASPRPSPCPLGQCEQPFEHLIVHTASMASFGALHSPLYRQCPSPPVRA